jgi:putative hemolysin
MVRDNTTGKVIACTRILTDDKAPDAGGFYSANEFDLAMIDSLPGRVMEIGRTCVDSEYRGGVAIAMLWQGIAAYVTGHGFDYLFGCASIGLEDGGATAHAILDTIRSKYLAPERQHVRPFIPLPAADVRATEKPKMPPLLKAYVSLGAKACGEAYWDRDFNCADVFMLLNVSDLNPRYARHFLGKTAAEQPAPVLNA